MIQYNLYNLNKLSSQCLVRLKIKLMESTKNKFNVNLARKYEARFKKYGATPKGSYWIDAARQNLRFQILLQETIRIQKQGSFSIGDIGCGYGALAHYIDKTVHAKSLSYHGYDISETLISYCKQSLKFDWVTFKQGSQPHIKLDFCLISGTYNMSASQNVDEWENYIFKNLSECWLKTKKAIIFNLQIDNVARISSENIFYGNKASILRRCNFKFGPTRSTSHASLLKDTTFIIQRK